MNKAIYKNMLQITKYLQYRNTPNNKPRVLREGVDYNTIYNNDLYLSEGEIIGRYIAAIEYCRPLLTVEIDGVEWTEGDIIKTLDENDNLGFLYFDQEDCEMRFQFQSSNTPLKCLKTLDFFQFKKQSFFDDPNKHSEPFLNLLRPKIKHYFKIDF